MKKQAKFGIGIGVIVVSLASLAWLGYGESKTYYHTIAELQTLHGADRSHRIRVGGTVAPGSIHRMTGHVDFVLEGEGKSLPVSYVGSDPLPDTFVDKAQALVEGRPARMGTLMPRSCRRSARPSTKRLQGEPQPPLPQRHRKATCKGPGSAGG